DGTAGNPDVVDTCSINGVAIGTSVPATGALAGHNIVGFASGTKISAVIDQINLQSSQSGVTASLDRNGVLVLQTSATNPRSIVVSNVDQVTADVNGADLTGGTGIPVPTGGI